MRMSEHHLKRYDGSLENEQKMEDCFSRQLLRQNESWFLF